MRRWLKPTYQDSSGAKSVKSVKLEKSEQGDCQKLFVLCSEFLLEVLEDEFSLEKWMECDWKMVFASGYKSCCAHDWNPDRTKEVP